MDPYYPFIKYKEPANLKLDGTDHFIGAELMRLKLPSTLLSDWFNSSLSFTCEKDQKAFYKLMKDCLRFRLPG